MNDLQIQAYLTTLYTQPYRKYHNIVHINECLTELEAASALCPISHHQNRVLETAIWFHDAVYNPYSSFNEEKSAALLKSCLTIPTNIRDEAVDAIIATKYHTKDQEDISDTTKLMLDIDLSGLGKDWKTFFGNTKNIHHEYYNTPIELFRKGRVQFFETLLQRQSIYYTDTFKTRYEAQARNNIQLEVELLKNENFEF